MFSEKKISEFLNQLSSNTPTPGGGTVAALSGGLAASLVSMVASLTV
jgi:glutamate formiminotransferase/formiminotetrahydrofolate cyclodeaminase